MKVKFMLASALLSSAALADDAKTSLPPISAPVGLSICSYCIQLSEISGRRVNQQTILYTDRSIEQIYLVSHLFGKAQNDENNGYFINDFPFPPGQSGIIDRLVRFQHVCKGVILDNGGFLKMNIGVGPDPNAPLGVVNIPIRGICDGTLIHIDDYAQQPAKFMLTTYMKDIQTMQQVLGRDKVKEILRELVKEEKIVDESALVAKTAERTVDLLKQGAVKSHN